ncbi:MAG: helix-turn-helix domain-containing protein, partial [Actinomycetota bacterium]
MEDYFVPVTTVAERLGVSSDTVSRWCRQGRIPGIKPGRDWRVPASVAEDLLAGRPARLWSADLEPQLERLRHGDHVLVLVPGGLREARAFLDVLRRMESQRAVTTPEPSPPPAGGVLSRAALTAGGRAVAAREMQLARSLPGVASKWLIRWVSRLGPESLEVE